MAGRNELLVNWPTLIIKNSCIT